CVYMRCRLPVTGAAELFVITTWTTTWSPFQPHQTSLVAIMLERSPAEQLRQSRWNVPATDVYAAELSPLLLADESAFDDPCDPIATATRTMTTTIPRAFI